ncbi:MAG: RtcB family protein [Gammaproteobacteria bacterium]|nr:RtcB family protein [Gammaproteobacteria bacterium]
MDINLFERISDTAWRINPKERMRVPAIIYADQSLLESMDHKVYEQVTNVATLPGIVSASYAMPDAHWGYGFPIGGVAAFDPEDGGVVSAGGVGFDISCGVRALHTGLSKPDVQAVKQKLADVLEYIIPAGVGSTGSINLKMHEMDEMLKGGAKWAVKRGWGEAADLERTEERGCMSGAEPSQVSDQAKKRQHKEMGTLGSGNHYLEVQCVEKIFQPKIASGFGLREGDILVSIHCGSRGLGHQIGTEFLRSMVISASKYNIHLPDRELACAPINSTLGASYLGAMRAAINCAFANRQILTHLTRLAFSEVIPASCLSLLYDVSHNTCKVESHIVNGKKMQLYVHRKGATRAYGPGHPDVTEALRSYGQPVLIGGSMGTCSYVLSGTIESEQSAFSSACHGAGRAMSRRQATKQWRGRELVDALENEGIIIRSPSLRGVAEEAPGAYKDVTDVVDAADKAGLAKKVAMLTPLICIKG